MSYIKTLNECIKSEVARRENIVLYGQNIDAGSCLSGLTRSLQVRASSRVINTPNSENTLVGVGFGLLLKGISSVFFVKQLDFILLGMDQIINTNNFIRMTKTNSSFTIMPIVVDSGYQGIQSSFNALGDICSIAQVPGFTINNHLDAGIVINEELFRPGFRIIGVSQRLFSEECAQIPQIKKVTYDNSLFKYANGDDLSIVCFNFSFANGFKLWEVAENNGYTASLYSANYASPMDWSDIVNDLTNTKRLVIIDDSKSIATQVDHLIIRVNQSVKLEYLKIIRRPPLESTLYPNSERLCFDPKEIITDAFLGKRIQ